MLGVSISPVAFLVIQNDNVKLMPVSHSSSINKLLDYVPDLLEKVNDVIDRLVEDKKIPNKIKKPKINEKKNEEKVKSEEVETEFEYDNTQDD